MEDMQSALTHGVIQTLWRNTAVSRVCKTCRITHNHRPGQPCTEGPAPVKSHPRVGKSLLVALEVAFRSRRDPAIIDESDSPMSRFNQELRGGTSALNLIVDNGGIRSLLSKQLNKTTLTLPRSRGSWTS